MVGNGGTACQLYNSSCKPTRHDCSCICGALYLGCAPCAQRCTRYLRREPQPAADKGLNYARAREPNRRLFVTAPAHHRRHMHQIVSTQLQVLAVALWQTAEQQQRRYRPTTDLPRDLIFTPQRTYYMTRYCQAQSEQTLFRASTNHCCRSYAAMLQTRPTLLAAGKEDAAMDSAQATPQGCWNRTGSAPRSPSVGTQRLVVVVIHDGQLPLRLLRSTHSRSSSTTADAYVFSVTLGAR